MVLFIRIQAHGRCFSAPRPAPLQESFMSEQIYREKSLERIASPEELNDYLHVTNPAVWLIMAAVIILLAGRLTGPQGAET